MGVVVVVDFLQNCLPSHAFSHLNVQYFDLKTPLEHLEVKVVYVKFFSDENLSTKHMSHKNFPIFYNIC
jgi:hypothetical protein